MALPRTFTNPYQTTDVDPGFLQSLSLSYQDSFRHFNSIGIGASSAHKFLTQIELSGEFSNNISEEEFNKLGLRRKKWNPNMTEGQAYGLALIQQQRDDEAMLLGAAHKQGGFFRHAGMVAASFAGNISDPLNWVPLIREAKYARLAKAYQAKGERSITAYLKRQGVTATAAKRERDVIRQNIERKFLKGTLKDNIGDGLKLGALGYAITEPGIVAGNAYLDRPYTVEESMYSLAFSTSFGAGFHLANIYAPKFGRGLQMGIMASALGGGIAHIGSLSGALSTGSFAGAMLLRPSGGRFRTDFAESLFTHIDKDGRSLGDLPQSEIDKVFMDWEANNALNSSTIHSLLLNIDPEYKRMASKKQSGEMAEKRNFFMSYFINEGVTMNEGDFTMNFLRAHAEDFRHLTSQERYSKIYTEIQKLGSSPDESALITSQKLLDPEKIKLLTIALTDTVSRRVKFFIDSGYSLDEYKDFFPSVYNYALNLIASGNVNKDVPSLFKKESEAGDAIHGMALSLIAESIAGGRSGVTDGNYRSHDIFPPEYKILIDNKTDLYSGEKPPGFVLDANGKPVIFHSDSSSSGVINLGTDASGRGWGIKIVTKLPDDFNSFKLSPENLKYFYDLGFDDVAIVDLAGDLYTRRIKPGKITDARGKELGSSLADYVPYNVQGLILSDRFDLPSYYQRTIGAPASKALASNVQTGAARVRSITQFPHLNLSDSFGAAAHFGSHNIDNLNNGRYSYILDTSGKIPNVGRGESSRAIKSGDYIIVSGKATREQFNQLGVLETSEVTDHGVFKVKRTHSVDSGLRVFTEGGDRQADFGNFAQLSPYERVQGRETSPGNWERTQVIVDGKPKTELIFVESDSNAAAADAISKNIEYGYVPKQISDEAFGDDMPSLRQILETGVAPDEESLYSKRTEFTSEVAKYFSDDPDAEPSPELANARAALGKWLQYEAYVRDLFDMADINGNKWNNETKLKKPLLISNSSRQRADEMLRGLSNYRGLQKARQQLNELIKFFNSKKEKYSRSRFFDDVKKVFREFYRENVDSPSEVGKLLNNIASKIGQGSHHDSMRLVDELAYAVNLKRDIVSKEDLDGIFDYKLSEGDLVGPKEGSSFLHSVHNDGSISIQYVWDDVALSRWAERLGTTPEKLKKSFPYRARAKALELAPANEGKPLAGDMTPEARAGWDKLNQSRTEGQDAFWDRVGQHELNMNEADSLVIFTKDKLKLAQSVDDGGIQGRMTEQIVDAIKPSAKKWLSKEQAKTRIATQFIGEGKADSSTDRYRNMYSNEGLANTGSYTSRDIIYVSSNGARRGGFRPVVDGKLHGAFTNIDKAIEAGSMFVMDTKAHLDKTARYNIGELALADYLSSKGYVRNDETGVWGPKGRDLSFRPTETRKHTTLETKDFEINSAIQAARNRGLDYGRGIYVVNEGELSGDIQHVGHHVTEVRSRLADVMRKGNVSRPYMVGDSSMLKAPEPTKGEKQMELASSHMQTILDWASKDSSAIGIQAGNSRRILGKGIEYEDMPNSLSSDEFDSVSSHVEGRLRQVVDDIAKEAQQNRVNQMERDMGNEPRDLSKFDNENKLIINGNQEGAGNVYTVEDFNNPLLFIPNVKRGDDPFGYVHLDNAAENLHRDVAVLNKEVSNELGIRWQRVQKDTFGNDVVDDLMGMLKAGDTEGKLTSKTDEFMQNMFSILDEMNVRIEYDDSYNGIAAFRHNRDKFFSDGGVFIVNKKKLQERLSGEDGVLEGRGQSPENFLAMAMREELIHAMTLDYIVNRNRDNQLGDSWDNVIQTSKDIIQEMRNMDKDDNSFTNFVDYYPFFEGSDGKKRTGTMDEVINGVSPFSQLNEWVAMMFHQNSFGKFLPSDIVNHIHNRIDNPKGVRRQGGKLIYATFPKELGLIPEFHNTAKSIIREIEALSFFYHNQGMDNPRYKDVLNPRQMDATNGTHTYLLETRSLLSRIQGMINFGKHLRDADGNYEVAYHKHLEEFDNSKNAHLNRLLGDFFSALDEVGLVDLYMKADRDLQGEYIMALQLLESGVNLGSDHTFSRRGQDIYLSPNAVAIAKVIYNSDLKKINGYNSSTGELRYNTMRGAPMWWNPTHMINGGKSKGSSILEKKSIIDSVKEGSIMQHLKNELQTEVDGYNDFVRFMTSQVDVNAAKTLGADLVDGSSIKRNDSALSEIRDQRGRQVHKDPTGYESGGPGSHWVFDESSKFYDLALMLHLQGLPHDHKGEFLTRVELEGDITIDPAKVVTIDNSLFYSKNIIEKYDIDPEGSQSGTIEDLMIRWFFSDHFDKIVSGKKDDDGDFYRSNRSELQTQIFYDTPYDRMLAMQEYSSYDPNLSIIMDRMSMAKNMALNEHYGRNNNFDSPMQTGMEFYRDIFPKVQEDFGKKKDSLYPFHWFFYNVAKRSPEDFAREAIGLNDISANNTIAAIDDFMKFGVFIPTTIGMAGVSSLVDFGTIRKTLDDSIGNFTHKKVITEIAKSYKRSPDAKRETLRLGVTAALTITNLIRATGASGANMNKMRNWNKFVFDVSGMNHVMEIGRTVFTSIFMTGLGEMSGTKFDDLNPETRSTLSKYNITPMEWDVIRASKNDIAWNEDGFSEMFPIISRVEFGDNLVDSLRILAASQGRTELNDAIMTRMANDLDIKYQKMLNSEMDRGVLMPDYLERTLFSLGYQRGTWQRAVLMNMALYHQYPMAFLRKHFAGNIADLFSGNPQSAIRTAYFMGYMVMIAYLLNMVKDLLSNREPRVWGKSAAWGAISGSGMGGIYTSMISGEWDNESSLVDRAIGFQLGVPGAKVEKLWDVLDAETPGTFGSKSIQAGRAFTPFQNNFMIKAALDRLVFQPSISAFDDGEWVKNSDRALEKLGSGKWLMEDESINPFD